MPVPDISLFSLEIVIDKLYVPNVTCRFPAVAFRLLDFPTILIKHVEDELGQRIKDKIARDQYYRMPDQFSELQDNHGTYIVEKGKSCLFKTSIESLKSHLSNTPLYVMLLDMYPDTPKLIGNSSVPLDKQMKDICVDVATKGVTVPSVHGEKGLFKVYNLMGKEMGYIILGFRLLCLGPSMIGHLTGKTMVQSNVDKNFDVENEKDGDNVTVIDVKPLESENVPSVKKFTRHQSTENYLRSSQDMGSMTDAMKHDVLIQTIPTEEKGVHVVISESSKPKASISTQTQKRKKQRGRHVLSQGIDMKPNGYEEDDDELEVPNIICPPPLFYNKYSEPKLTVERPIDYTDDESDITEISEIGSVNGYKEITETTTSGHDKKVKVLVPSSKQSHDQPKQLVPTKQTQNLRNNLPNQLVDGQSQNVFPVLTALLNELIGIQGTQGLENVIHRVNNVGVVPHQVTSNKGEKTKETISSPRSVSRPTLSSTNKANIIKSDSDKPSRNKGWIRKTPSAAPSKGPLTYRLTKTQKLRIAKGNPKWLEEKEKKEELLKPQNVAKEVQEKEGDLSVTNFSDTLTEVRRLAEKELADQTLDSIQDLHESRGSSIRTGSAHKKRKPKAKPRSPKHVRRNKEKDSRTPKEIAHNTVKIANPIVVSNQADMSTVAVEPDLKRFVDDDSSDVSVEEADRASSVLSQKSMEVHIPKVIPEVDSEEEIELPDNDKEGSNIMGMLRKSQTSFDMSEPVDNVTPLESTRTSQSQFDIVDTNIQQSTIENDTKQFLSTEEPELQKLMSDDDNSDVSELSQKYVPTFATGAGTSLRASLKFPVVNPVASQNSPIPATRKSTVKADGKVTPRRSENISSPGSSRVITPRKKYIPKARESIHTESVSSYQPSDGDAVLSMASSINYSDDFQISVTGSPGSSSDLVSSPEVPRRIPTTKLGYTIN